MSRILPVGILLLLLSASPAFAGDADKDSLSGMPDSVTQVLSSSSGDQDRNKADEGKDKEDRDKSDDHKKKHHDRKDMDTEKDADEGGVIPPTPAPTPAPDTTPPVVTAPANITKEATGPLTPVALSATTVTDNVNTGLTATASPTGPFAVGVHTVTWTATDTAGNVGSGTQTVTITDTTAPVITAPAAVSLASTNGSPVTGNIGQATATDLFTVTITNDASAAFPVGTTTVTWTATDANGNSATAAQLVTVTVNIADTTPPVITVPANVTAEATGVQTSVNIGTATATDNIDGAVPVTSNAPASFPVGTTVITYTASDAAGNTATATQSVTVVDTTAPVILAPAAVTLTSSGGSPVSGNIGQAIAADAFAVTISNDAPAAFPVGVTTVTWTATDANGNTATATQAVTVNLVDTTPPVVTAPANVTVEATGPLTTVSLGAATAADNADGNLIPVNDAPVGGFPVGTTTVTWSATDAAGNTGMAMQTVTVVDTTAPVITAPAAASLISTDGNPVAGNIGQATATDLFAATITNDAPAAFPVGTTMVTWTATDANGNTTTATQLVTVIANIADTTPPVITAPAAVTAEATGAQTTVNIGTATATDNIDGAVVVTSNAPATLPLGTTTVTYSATDAAGNTATTAQAITVVDTAAPVITAPAAVTATSGNNQPVAVSLGQATATDLFAVTISNNAPATFPVGATTVTWTATDANGNSTTATQLVTVTVNIADTTPPVITVPANVTAEATGVQTAMNIGTATATDNIDGAVPVTSNAPASFPPGVTTVMYTATDAAGNQATATQRVTVVDTTPPGITAPAAVSLTSTNGSPVTGNIGQATATDIFAVTITNNAPATFPAGVTTVTWTATDANGNSATATQLVTVAQQLPATFTFTAPPDLVLQSFGGNGIPASQVNFGTPTVQSRTAVQWKRSNPNIFPVGASQVTWTATDANGNTITAIQKVTVVFTQDAIPPVITAPADARLITLDGNPVAASIGQAVAADNSGAVTVTNNAPAAYPVGTTTVLWTATDTAGNTATATQQVTVTWDQTILTTLPPDPGAAGKATLAGIDSDNDGVRDDVQRWIALTYPNSQKTRAALRQDAKAMQVIILNASNPAIARANSIAEGRASDCIRFVRRQVLGTIVTDTYQINREMEAVFLNTAARSRAWLQADHYLSGMMFNVPIDLSASCNFNANTMPN